ncbi:hypothetical protein J2W17_004698 [Pseudomonas lini]|nr:hypothetical protein [Pseudomonas lini]
MGISSGREEAVGLPVRDAGVKRFSAIASRAGAFEK